MTLVNRALRRSTDNVERELYLEQGMMYDIEPPITADAIPSQKGDRHYGWRKCTFPAAIFLGTWDDQFIFRGKPADGSRESLFWLRPEELEGRNFSLSGENL